MEFIVVRMLCQAPDLCDELATHGVVLNDPPTMGAECGQFCEKHAREAAERLNTNLKERS